MTGVVITPLQFGDLDKMAGALTAARLPVADMGESGRTFFRFEDAEGLIGYGCLEGGSSDRLLRSIVVVPDRRGAGAGRAMVAALEQVARGLGVQRLHLLTTTAAPFFCAMGYAAADRDAAPTAIASSLEFTSLCPASADYLLKVL